MTYGNSAEFMGTFTHCYVAGAGLDGGWGSDLLLIQLGGWLLNCARQLQQIQQQLL